MVAVPGGLRGPVIAVLLAVSFAAWQHAVHPSGGPVPAEVRPAPFTARLAPAGAHPASPHHLFDSCPQTPPPGPPAPALPQPRPDDRSADGVYIVRFKGYAMAGEHRNRLAPALAARRWEWVDRNNPAARFPTDFGLVRADGASLEEVQVSRAAIL